MTALYTDRLNGLNGDLAVKAPCRAATTANITLSGTQTIDGVAVVADDRVLVKDQASSVDNGIWIVGSGAWTRALDFNGSRDCVGGTMVLVVQGSTNSNSYWRVDGIGAKTPSTDAITFSAAFVDDSATATFLQAGTGAVTRTAQSKMRDAVSVKDFGATGLGVAADTTAIQAAIDTGATSIYFPDGNYLHGNLTISTNYQRFYGPGAKLIRNAAGTTITVSGRGVHFDDLRFGCQSSGMAGNNITVTGPDFRITNCESRDCAGRALLVANAGGGIMITGGVYQTTDATSSGYDIEIRDDAGGGNTLYCAISKIITNQAQGGILITGEVGSMAIDKCQFGKLRMESGGASKVSNSRINGTTTILSGFATFVNNELKGNVVFGTSGGSNIGSIRFAASNSMDASASLTIENNVIESTFHLGQIISTGSTVTINSYNNDIWHQERDVTLTLGAESGSPTFGNGTVVAKMSAAGRQRFLSVDFTLGTTSNMGGGTYFYIVAPFIAKSSVTSTAYVLDSGTGHFDLTVRQLASSNQIFFFPSSGGTTAVSSGAAFNNPMTWATGDRLIFSLNAEQTF